MASDVFVSYSRKDQAAARGLAEALSARGREAWVDWEGIAPTAEWLKAILAAIEGSSAFVVLCTPDALASEVCGMELRHAVDSRKRIIPIVVRDFDAAEAPDALRRLNWIFLREGDDFDAGVEALLVAVDTDFEWVGRHTRLLVRATEWRDRARERSLLLRGADLADAEAWVAQAGREGRPEATGLQREYIAASRVGALRRRRAYAVGSTLLLAVVAVLGAFVFLNADRARTEAAAALSRRLAQQSMQMRGERPDLHERALLLAAESLLRAPVPTPESDHALRSLLAVMPRHLGRLDTGGARADGIVYSADGSRAAWSPPDGTVRLWKVGDDAAAVRALPAAGRIDRLALDADGTTLLSVVGRRLARLHDGAGGRLRAEVAPPPGVEVADAFLSPGGGRLAALGTDGRLRFHGPDGEPAGELAVDLHTPREPHVQAAFGAGDRLVAVASVRALRVCEAASLAACPPPVEDRVAHRLALEFSPGGEWLAVGEPGRVRVLGREGGWVSGFDVALSGGPVRLRFSPDGRWLAVAGGDGAVRVWDVARRAEAMALAPAPFPPALGFAADSARLLVSTHDTAAVWSVPGGRRLALVSQGGPAAFVGDGRRMATAGGGAALHLWETRPEAAAARLDAAPPDAFAFDAQGNLLAARTAPAGDPQAASISRRLAGAGRVDRIEVPASRGIVLSADGRRAWAGQGDRVVAWDLASWRELSNAPHVPPIDWDSLLPALKEARCSRRDTFCRQRLEQLAARGSVEVVAVSPGGTYAGTVRADAAARVWQAGVGTALISQPRALPLALTQRHAVLGLLPGDDGGRDGALGRVETVVVRELPGGAEAGRRAVPHGVRVAMAGPDGGRVLLVGGDHSLEMLELPSARPLWRRPPASLPPRIAFGAGGALVALSAGGGDAVVVVDAASGRPVGVPVPWPGGASVLALDPHGALLAIGGPGGGTSVREVRSGTETARLRHEGRVRDLAFSHDARTLASAGDDGVVRLFDLAGGREIARIVPAGEPRRVAFAPDDRLLAVGGAGEVGLWAWRVADLVAEACRRVASDLSPETWRLHLGDASPPRACRTAP